jgi:hypothetical protein
VNREAFPLIDGFFSHQAQRNDKAIHLDRHFAIGTHILPVDKEAYFILLPFLRNGITLNCLQFFALFNVLKVLKPIPYSNSKTYCNAEIIQKQKL